MQQVVSLQEAGDGAEDGGREDDAQGDWSSSGQKRVDYTSTKKNQVISCLVVRVLIQGANIKALSHNHTYSVRLTRLGMMRSFSFVFRILLK